MQQQDADDPELSEEGKEDTQDKPTLEDEVVEAKDDTEDKQDLAEEAIVKKKQATMSDEKNHIKSRYAKIPIMKEGMTAIQYALKEPQLRSVMDISGCIECFSETRHKDLPAKADGATTKEEEVAVLKHRNCISIMIQSFGENTQLTLALQSTVNDDWPTGQSHLVIKKINIKFKRQGSGTNDRQALAARKKAFEAVKMEQRDNPAVMFQRFDELILQYGTSTNRLTDEEIMAMVHEKIPVHYLSVLANHETRLKITGDIMTYDIMQDVINDWYEEITNHDGKQWKSSNLKEIALLAASYKQASNSYKSPGRGGAGRGGYQRRQQNQAHGRFAAKTDKACYYCHKVGHMKRDCNKHKADRRDLQCSHCNMNGHIAETCYKLHPELKPANGGARFGKVAGEHANANIDDIDIFLGAFSDHDDDEDSFNEDPQDEIDDEYEHVNNYDSDAEIIYGERPSIMDNWGQASDQEEQAEKFAMARIHRDRRMEGKDPVAAHQREQIREQARELQADQAHLERVEMYAERERMEMIMNPEREQHQVIDLTGDVVLITTEDDDDDLSQDTQVIAANRAAQLEENEMFAIIIDTSITMQKRQNPRDWADCVLSKFLFIGIETRSQLLKAIHEGVLNRRLRNQNKSTMNKETIDTLKFELLRARARENRNISDE